jgi:hypothetical protein
MKNKVVALIAAVVFFAVSVSPFALAGNNTTKSSNKTAIENTNTNRTASDSTKAVMHKSKKSSKKYAHHKHSSKSMKGSKKGASKTSKDTTVTK